MLNKVKTYLIVGSLGVGKTSFIEQLLKQKPSNESWAILINEFGKVGVDKALLETNRDEVTITEIAGGCLCCTGGAPFQVGLTRLLKEAMPNVVFIELLGLGHPLQVLRQLQQAPWDQVLSLYPLLQIVDVQQNLSKVTVYSHTGLLLINKSEQVDAEQKEIVAKQFAPLPVYWATQGYLPITFLPKQPLKDLVVPQIIYLPTKAEEQQSQIAEGIVYRIQEQEEGWSIGWCLQAGYCFDQVRLTQWLEQLSWVRAKLVVHTKQGWQSYNAVNKLPANWRATEWRKDSRIELIFSRPQEEQMLITTLLACLN